MKITVTIMDKGSTVSFTESDEGSWLLGKRSPGVIVLAVIGKLAALYSEQIAAAASEAGHTVRALLDLLRPVTKPEPAEAEVRGQVAAGLDYIKRRASWNPDYAPPGTCKLSPDGWYCTLDAGHDGPCPTVPKSWSVHWCGTMRAGDGGEQLVELVCNHSAPHVLRYVRRAPSLARG